MLEDPAPLRVFAARAKRWRSAEFPEWHYAYDLIHDEDEGTWSIRVWSFFDNGWNWREIREPEILLDGREELVT